MDNPEAQQLPASGIVESRLGQIELTNGYPTDATARRVFDEIDFQRGCQAYLWALPLMAMQQWQAEQREKFGAGNLDFVDYLTFTDKLGLLTANATTPYIMAFPSMEGTGPLVMEIPAGPTAGGVVDFWQRPITDSGQTGPDKGAGGKYLILGPNDPEMRPEGYHVFRSSTVNVWVAHRVLEPDREKAMALVAAIRIYPYNRMIMGMLQPLGIEKGRPFNPDARQTQTLIEAARVGEVMARTIGYEKRFHGAKVWPGKQWDLSLFLEETNQEAAHHTQLDERTSWFYEAVGVSVGMMGRTVGLGQVYLESSKDSQGRWLVRPTVRADPALLRPLLGTSRH